MLFSFTSQLNMDFTCAKYNDLCETIVESEYKTLTFTHYFSASDIPEKFILLRHDVDREPEMALGMAELEYRFGITATYYFRMKEDVFKPEILKKIADMGHEIGYHYEVLDKAKGVFDSAIEIFEAELVAFRKICNVKTICSHGNPLTKWVNTDLWKEYEFKDFGIIGEPYLSLDYGTVFYLSDTNRRWGSRFSGRNVVAANSQSNEKIKSTDDIMAMIKVGSVEQICILTHPNRWSDSFAGWLKELTWQNVKNVGKVLLVKINRARSRGR